MTPEAEKSTSEINTQDSDSAENLADEPNKVIKWVRGGIGVVIFLVATNPLKVVALTAYGISQCNPGTTNSSHSK